MTLYQITSLVFYSHDIYILEERLNYYGVIVRTTNLLVVLFRWDTQIISGTNPTNI